MLCDLGQVAVPFWGDSVQCGCPALSMYLALGAALSTCLSPAGFLLTTWHVPSCGWGLGALHRFGSHRPALRESSLEGRSSEWKSWGGTVVLLFCLDSLLAQLCFNGQGRRFL